MADYGIKVSKAGQDVYDADRYQIMTSKYPFLKLKQSGQGSYSKSNTQDSFTITIAHNLGYKPLCFVFGQHWTYNGGMNTEYQDWTYYEYSGLGVREKYYFYTDNTNLYIVYNGNYLTEPETFTVAYMYFIYYDENTI